MNNTPHNLPADEIKEIRNASGPMFFGSVGEDLFGWLHGSATESSGRVGVVVCGTLGAESLTSHRTLRALAESLAEYNITTLRFDYASTGNSVDPQGEPPRLSVCIDNVRTAIRTIRAAASVDRVFVVGVRLGALFAAKATELEEVSGLILWGPVVSGKGFAREWKMIARSSEHFDGLDEDSVLAAGFSLEKNFLDALAAISLFEIEPLGSPACFVVEREEFPPEDKLVERFKELGLTTDRCRPGGFLAAMIPDPHLTKLPVDAIHEIREWIAKKSQSLSAQKLADDQSFSRMTKTVVISNDDNPGSISIRERFLNCDEIDGPFGVVSEPIDPDDWNGQCLILLNSGSVHHIGPNRMYVAIARRMAAKGSRVCRADLRGLGDSPVRAGARENDPYPAGAIDDIAQIVSSLTSSDTCSRIGLAGLCSGAWASFHGGLMIDGITDIALLNPDFYGERSVVGKPSSFVRPKDYSHYKHSAKSWAKWKKLLAGRADLAKIVRVLWNQAQLALASWRARATGEQHQLDADLTRLAISGVRVGFIFSPGDGGLDFLRMHGRSGIEQLRRSGLTRELIISDADHTFTTPSSQIRLEETLSEWLR